MVVMKPNGTIIAAVFRLKFVTFVSIITLKLQQIVFNVVFKLIRKWDLPFLYLL